MDVSITPVCGFISYRGAKYVGIVNLNSFFTLLKLQTIPIVNEDLAFASKLPTDILNTSKIILF